MNKIPVNIISGFLGSGKTTAIIHLLNQKCADEKWAVIINEFGKISIDGQTLKSSSETGTVFEVSGGCICCSAKGYFHENLNQIIGTGKYQRIIIEPSGLGGIDMVLEIVKAKPLVQLMPVICMVDITSLENQRLQMNFLYKTQISKADLIVFSKCDLVSDSELQDRLVMKFKSSFPENSHCLLGLRLHPSLLQMNFQDDRSTNFSQVIFESKANQTTENYEESDVVAVKEIIFDSQKLMRYFQNHPSIIRAKGHLLTESGWKLVNYTLSGCIFDTCPEKAQNEIIFISEKTDSGMKNLESDFEEIFLK